MVASLDEAFGIDTFKKKKDSKKKDKKKQQYIYRDNSNIYDNDNYSKTTNINSNSVN